jgi:hypothetical protein
MAKTKRDPGEKKKKGKEKRRKKKEKKFFICSTFRSFADILLVTPAIVRRHAHPPMLFSASENPSSKKSSFLFLKTIFPGLHLHLAFAPVAIVLNQALFNLQVEPL